MKSLIELRIENLRIRTNIEQMYIDAAYWNNNVRKADEAPIDPDPDGVQAAIWLAYTEDQSAVEQIIYQNFTERFGAKTTEFLKWKNDNPGDHRAMLETRINLSKVKKQSAVFANPCVKG